MKSVGCGNTTSFLRVLTAHARGDNLVFWTHPGQLGVRALGTNTLIGFFRAPRSLVCLIFILLSAT
jgi:hypothetical protein